jgi:hypothetical protein
MAFLGGLVIIFVGVIFDAFVLTKLWQWFIVSLFDLPTLNIAYAYGLSLLFKYMNKDQKQEDMKDKKLWEAFVIMFLRSGLVLLVSYIVYQFV